MMSSGRLVVVRPAGRWRDNRGRPDVRVDGRIRGQLGAGGTVECDLAPGEHRVQVGREVPTSGRMVFFGSPILTVPVEADGETRVRVEPSGIPLRRQVQLHLPESTYRLSVEGAASLTTSAPSVSPDAPPGRLWTLNLFTRGLLDRARPWRTWQGAATLFLILYAGWQSALALRARAISPFGWIWLAFIAFATLWTVSAWLSLLRARNRHRTPSP